jgi:hypothetical protein
MTAVPTGLLVVLAGDMFANCLALLSAKPQKRWRVLDV